MNRIDAIVPVVERIKQATLELDAKIDRTAAQLNARIDSTTAGLSARIDATAAASDKKLAVAVGDLRAEIRGLETVIERQKTELIRWAVGFWLVSMLTVVGAIATLARMLR